MVDRVKVFLVTRRVLGQPRYCIGTNTSRGLSPTAEFLVIFMILVLLVNFVLLVFYVLISFFIINSNINMTYTQ